MINPHLRPLANMQGRESTDRVKDLCQWLGQLLFQLEPNLKDEDGRSPTLGSRVQMCRSYLGDLLEEVNSALGVRNRLEHSETARRPPTAEEAERACGHLIRAVKHLLQHSRIPQEFRARFESATFAEFSQASASEPNQGWDHDDDQ